MKLIATAALLAICIFADEVKVTVRQGEPRGAVSDGRNDALRIFIDPQTGELREAPPSSSVQRSAARTSAPSVVAGKDGSSSVVLGAEHRIYTIATVQPDGSTKVTEAKPVRKAKKVRK